MSSSVDKKQFGGNTGPPVGRMYLKTKGCPGSGDLTAAAPPVCELLVNLLLAFSAQCRARNVAFHLLLLFVASGMLLHHPANRILPYFVGCSRPGKRFTLQTERH